MKRLREIPLAAVLSVVVLVSAAAWFLGRDPAPAELTRAEFDEAVAAEEIDLESVEIKARSQEIRGDFAEGVTGEDGAEAFVVAYTSELSDEIQQDYPDLPVDTQRESIWVTLAFNFLPMLLLIGIFLWFITSLQGGGGPGGMRSFGKAKAHKAAGDQTDVTFADVAGQDEALEELVEIREFLRNPERFAAIGAKIPKGVLLYGPPGTGKTLLARAVAGEAGAPFYSISGSDFVEMFVGVGASRVRDLFSQAKENAPAIIFVDEIDAVGRHRGAGLGGGHDEREQTLNQLLVEMDGFDATTGVIMIAASNRPDILDPALLRPGRFDRQIVVDVPDLNGRVAILGVHAKGKPLADDVDIDVIARRTPGFTGADLANLLNESALLAARADSAVITHDHVEAAIDRVIAGPERKNRFMSDKEKRVIAYHEAGHALVGHVLPNTPPIHKVSIIARGRALGWTLSLPEEDRYLQTRSELEDQLAMLLGGRTAEEIIFGDPTTGASDDIERTTDIARAMVTQFGMTERLGPLRLGQEQGEVFLGRDVGHQANYSDHVAAEIDGEIRRIVDSAHDEAREILTLHRATLDRLADALCEKETLDDKDLAELFADIDGVTDERSALSGSAQPGSPVGPRDPSDQTAADSRLSSSSVSESAPHESPGADSMEPDPPRPGGGSGSSLGDAASTSDITDSRAGSTVARAQSDDIGRSGRRR